mmetsp:Transcript_25424/g.57357  ORF Transcript_25424/g.57357 Transcript_25424/m.57357 type:complete len:248 (+) Transcript_25424:496-1239(+)
MVPALQRRGGRVDVPGAGARDRGVRGSHAVDHPGRRRRNGGRRDLRGLHGDQVGAEEGLLRDPRLLPVPARAGAEGLPSPPQGRDEGGPLHVPPLRHERRVVQPGQEGRPPAGPGLRRHPLESPPLRRRGPRDGRGVPPGQHVRARAPRRAAPPGRPAVPAGAPHRVARGVRRGGRGDGHCAGVRGEGDATRRRRRDAPEREDGGPRGLPGRPAGGAGEELRAQGPGGREGARVPQGGGRQDQRAVG